MPPAPVPEKELPNTVVKITEEKPVEEKQLVEESTRKDEILPGKPKVNTSTTPGVKIPDAV